MTLKQLLGYSIEEQEVMTDAQLLEVFQPFLHITRVDQQKDSPAKLLMLKGSKKGAATLEKQKIDQMEMQFEALLAKAQMEGPK